MTDKELLELAAKAAGIDIQPSERHGYAHQFIVKAAHEIWVIWNPLTDDGDALRLAVKLKLPFESNWALGSVDSWYVGGVAHVMLNNSQVDPYAATRRAIVRAAAEIGAGMRPFPTAEEIRSDWLGLSEDDDGVLMK